MSAKFNKRSSAVYMVKIIVVVILVFSLILSPYGSLFSEPRRAEASTQSVTQITTGPYSQNQPAIYGNRIVYADHREASRIYMYDLTTQQETQITFSPGSQGYPRIYEDKIVYMNNQDEVTSIWLYDISTNEHTCLATNNVFFPKIYGDKIAYLATGPTWFDNMRILVYDLETGETEQAAFINYQEQHPTFNIWEDIVVWDENRDGQWSIYWCNLTEKVEKKIDTSGLPPKFRYLQFYQVDHRPDIDDGKVVWERQVRGWNYQSVLPAGWISDIYMYDLQTGRITQITDEGPNILLSFHPGGPSRPRIFGDKIIHHDYGYGQWSAYSLSKNVTIKNAAYTSEWGDAAIFGDKVVYERRVYEGPMRSRLDIYMTDLSALNWDDFTYTHMWSVQSTLDRALGIFSEKSSSVGIGKNKAESTLLEFTQQQKRGLSFGLDVGFGINPMLNAKVYEIKGEAGVVNLEGEKYSYPNLADKEQQRALAALSFVKLANAADITSPWILDLIGALKPEPNLLIGDGYSKYRTESMSGAGFSAEAGSRLKADVRIGFNDMSFSEAIMGLPEVASTIVNINQVFSRHEYPQQREYSYKGMLSSNYLNEDTIKRVLGAAPDNSDISTSLLALCSVLGFNGYNNFEQEIVYKEGSTTADRIVFRFYISPHDYVEFTIRGSKDLEKIKQESEYFTSVISVAKNLHDKGRAALLLYAVPVEFGKLLAKAEAAGITIERREYSTITRTDVSRELGIDFSAGLRIALKSGISFYERVKYLSAIGIQGEHITRYGDPVISLEKSLSSLWAEIFGDLWDYLEGVISVIERTIDTAEWFIETSHTSLFGSAMSVSEPIEISLATINEQSDSIDILGSSLFAAKSIAVLEPAAKKIYRGLTMVGGTTLIQPIDYRLNIPATLTLAYTDAQAEGLDKNSFAIFRYDEEHNRWQKMTSVTDPGNNKVSAQIIVLGTYTIGVDQSPPVITIITPEDKSHINTTALNIEVKIEDLATGLDADTVSIKLDGQDIYYSFNQSSIAYTAVSGLADGSYSIEVVASDLLGQQASAEATFVVDTVAPSVPTRPTLAKVDSKVLLSWGPSASSDVSHYNIYRNVVAGGDTILYGFSQTTSFEDISFSDTDITYEVAAVDGAGNESSRIRVESTDDTTPPTTTITLSGAQGNNNWYTSDVTVTLEAADNEGGVGVNKTEYSFNGTDWNTYSAAFKVTSEGTTTLYYRSVDNADNVEDIRQEQIKIDKTLPSIIIGEPQDKREYLLNQLLFANWLTSDSLSGIFSEAGTAAKGLPIDTRSVGTKTFTVEATDNAGNRATKTHTYFVHYDYSGILQPINTDRSSLFKAGSTIPVKFQLQDANGTYVSDAVANIGLVYEGSGITGATEEIYITTVASSGTQFRYDATSNQYIYNLSTKGMATGAWRIEISLDDGTTKKAWISLK